VLIPVLLYHSIGESRSWGAVPKRQYLGHVDAIAASGRTAISMSTLADGLRADCVLPLRPVCVTFDDGYDDTCAAVEILHRRGLVATVYQVSGELGANGRLSGAQLNELSAMPGVEIGAHAVRHRRLDELDDHELTEELVLSKHRLQEILGRPVSSFAYPHGAYDRRVRAGVIAAGYRSAAAVKNAISHSADDPFAIARWTVTATTSRERITEVLEGGGVPLAWARERLRTRAARTVRRQRHRMTRARTWAR
jgi:peptidoglycan/xylan/chitin deacetylase (PgdA/CDA1 family)